MQHRERSRAREKDRESFNSFIMHLIECVWLYLAVSVAAQELIDLSAHLCGDELRLNTADCLQMKHTAQFHNNRTYTSFEMVLTLRYFSLSQNHTFTIL